MSEEEKEAIKNAKEVLKLTTYLADIGHKDLEILLNLIEKQEKVIDEVIKCVLLHKTFSTFVCKDVSVNDCNKYRDSGGCNNCIKQYFYRKEEKNE